MNQLLLEKNVKIKLIPENNKKKDEKPSDLGKQLANQTIKKITLK
ncbi:hypothetical protein [Peribacillus butanolivorans]